MAIAERRQMTAEERRAWHEQAVRDGGSVFHGGRIIVSETDLPSKGDMATTDQERYEALDDLERRRQALNDEEARIRSASGSVAQPDGAPQGESIPEGDALPEDFPGRKALVDAGYETKSSVDGLSEDELTGIPGIGAATAAKIMEARG